MGDHLRYHLRLLELHPLAVLEGTEPWHHWLELRQAELQEPHQQEHPLEGMV